MQKQQQRWRWQQQQAARASPSPPPCAVSPIDGWRGGLVRVEQLEQFTGRFGAHLRDDDGGTAAAAAAAVASEDTTHSQPPPLEVEPTVYEVLRSRTS